MKSDHANGRAPNRRIWLVIFVALAIILFLAVRGREGGPDATAARVEGDSKRRSTHLGARSPLGAPGNGGEELQSDTADGSTGRRSNAPRHLGRGITPHDVGDYEQWPKPGIDTCTFSPIDANILAHSAKSADFVALVDIDYDASKSASIIGDGGDPVSIELTPLEVRKVVDVLVDRLDAPFESIRMTGKCDSGGLCKLSNCPRYVWSGLALVIATRFCGGSVGDQGILLATEIFPIERDALYDNDGSALSWSALSADIVREKSPRDTCGKFH